MCLIFIRELQLIVDSDRQIFEKLFMQFYLKHIVFVRNILRRYHRRNAWDTNTRFTPNKPIHHLLDYYNSLEDDSLKKFSQMFGVNNANFLPTA